MKKDILTLAEAESKFVVFNPEQASIIRGGTGETTDDKDEEDEEPMQ